MNSLNNIVIYRENLIAPLKSIEALEDGWSVTGEGEKISVQVLERAQEIFQELHSSGFHKCSFQPGLAGEVFIRSKSENKALDIIVTKEHGCELYVEVDGNDVEEFEQLDKIGLSKHLGKIANQWLPTSEYSTLTGFRMMVHTAGWLSGLEATNQYPSSMKIALLNTAKPYVTTYGSIIPE